LCQSTLNGKPHHSVNSRAVQCYSYSTANVQRFLTEKTSDKFYFTCEHYMFVTPERLSASWSKGRKGEKEGGGNDYFLNCSQWQWDPSITTQLMHEHCQYIRDGAARLSIILLNRHIIEFLIAELCFYRQGQKLKYNWRRRIYLLYHLFAYSATLLPFRPVSESLDI
jgi:hypothetical protein